MLVCWVCLTQGAAASPVRIVTQNFYSLTGWPLRPSCCPAAPTQVPAIHSTAAFLDGLGWSAPSAPLRSALTGSAGPSPSPSPASTPTASSTPHGAIPIASRSVPARGLVHHESLPHMASSPPLDLPAAWMAPRKHRGPKPSHNSSGANDAPHTTTQRVSSNGSSARSSGDNARGGGVAGIGAAVQGPVGSRASSTTQQLPSPTPIPAKWTWLPAGQTAYSSSGSSMGPGAAGSVHDQGVGLDGSGWQARMSRLAAAAPIWSATWSLQVCGLLSTDRFDAH